MRSLIAFLCFTLAVLFGSAGSSWGADWEKGVTAYKSGDYATALREWTPLAEQGDAAAQYKLGLMYHNVRGVPQDDRVAVTWYRLAANQGDAHAQYNLGVMYERGSGVPQDYKTAVTWYRLAAEQGDAVAQYNLGLMYHNGRGVPQDYKAAVTWYRLAAKQGYANAQYNLGLMYAKGNGVLKDYVRAYMWWSIAASHELKIAAKNSAIGAEQMTLADISKAQDLARECVRKKYRGC